MSNIKIYRDLPTDLREIYRYARAELPDQSTQDLINACLNELKPRLNYQICYEIFPISCKGNMLDIGFAKSDSSLARKALHGCDKVVLFAATVGLAPDQLIYRYSALSPAKALLLQAIGTQAVETLCDTFVAELETKGHRLSPRISPGYGDLPLALQKDIFNTLDCQKIGLTLNDQLLMIPQKSVTALMGIKSE